MSPALTFITGLTAALTTVFFVGAYLARPNFDRVEDLTDAAQQIAALHPGPTLDRIHAEAGTL